MATAKKNGRSSEDLTPPLAALISKGRREGMLTSAEVLSTLEKLELSVEKIEQIYDTFESMGIQIVNSDVDSEALPDLLDDMDTLPLEDDEEETLVDPVELAAE